MRKFTLLEEREYEDKMYEHAKWIYLKNPTDENRMWLCARMDRLNKIDAKVLAWRRNGLQIREERN